jgi:hypothetical protein
MKPMLKHAEAIGLALVIAAVLGGWMISALERAADPEKVCALRVKPGSADESLWNLHCTHVAEIRARNNRPMLAGNGGTGAELSAVMGHPAADSD